MVKEEISPAVKKPSKWNLFEEVPKVVEKPLYEKKVPKSSPLISKEEKDYAMDFGLSFDSKKVNETIENVDMEVTCRCFAHAIKKHIDFSRGELLIDDLVAEDQDIPQFSYKLGEELKIDLEEIQRRKEYELYENEMKNLEHYHWLQQMMMQGQIPMPDDMIREEIAMEEFQMFNGDAA